MTPRMLALFAFATSAIGCGSKDIEPASGDFFAQGSGDKSQFGAGVSNDLRKGSSQDPTPTSGSNEQGSSATNNAPSDPKLNGSASQPQAQGSDSGSSSGSAGSAGSATAPPPKRDKVSVPPELAAIELALAPGWERDVGEAGTFSIFLPLADKGLGPDTIFAFQYGYESESAPSDRDAYKKWLADKKIMTVKKDRQRAVGWFLDGVDMGGVPAFRYLVRYRGKVLMCGGSRYRDPDSDKLGKLRDEVVIQAERACESIALRRTEPPAK